MRSEEKRNHRLLEKAILILKPNIWEVNAMRKIMLAVIIQALLAMPLSLSAKTPVDRGFFIGGNISGLLMNGSGTYSDVDEDFDVTDEMVVFSESYAELTIEYPGWGWESRLLQGFTPLAGYRVSPKLAFVASYSLHSEKKGSQTQRLKSEYLDNFYYGSKSRMVFSQNTLHIWAQYDPANGHFFLMGGVELVRMRAELTNTITVDYKDPYYPFSDAATWTAEGSDNAIGLFFGAGTEIQISPTISLVTTAHYSLTRYTGSDLLTVAEAPGPVDDPSLDLELGIGGFGGEIGLRVYLPSGR